MYNNLFVTLQHSTEVVYFQIIIWYTFALSFTLMKHAKRVSSYAIIDDMDNMLPEQQSHFVQTNPEVGITEGDADTIITILNKEL